MKKFFALITAALMSVSVFASKDVVPSDDVLAGYYGEGQVCVCIFVPADMACNDIVLTGSFNGWLSTAADCPAFVAVEGYDGWYVAAFNPEAEPDAEKGIQAKPVMLDVDGNFNWEYQVGAATVIRGGVTVVQGAYAGEIDLFYYGTDAPNVFTVDQWKQNPCTAIYHNYTITVISDGCDGNAVPYLIGVMNNWTFQQMELDADKTAENKAPTYTVSFKVAEGSSYQIVSGLKDESGEIVEEPAWSENSYLQKLVDNEWVRIPGEDGDNLLTHENASILWDLRDDTLRWARCDEAPVENVVISIILPRGNAPDAVEIIGSFDEWVGTPMEYNATNNHFVAQFTAMSWDYFKFRSAGSWEQEIEIYNAQDDIWARITDNQFKFGNLWTDDYYEGNPVKLIELDWSDPDTYRWVSDSAPQEEVTLWLGNVLVGTGTDTGQDCQAEPFRTSDYNKEMFAGLQMGDLIMIDTENAENARYILYYWAASDSNWVQLSENDGVYKDSTIIYIKVESEDVAQSIADNGIIVMGTCFYIVNIYAYCAQCGSSSEPEPVTSDKVNIDGIFYILDSKTLSAEVTYEGDDEYISNPDMYVGDIVIPASITYNDQTYKVNGITNSAFRDCSKLTSVDIPNTVYRIGDNAFINCSGLTAVTIPESVTFVGWGAFYGCGLTSIFIPKSVSTIYGYTFAWCNDLQSIVVEEGNAYYDSRDNCNAIIETATNTLIAGCVTTIIPDNIDTIGYESFAQRAGLTAIEIPNSIQLIHGAAFESCWNLESITIPANVTSIGMAAFEHCSSLVSVTCEALTPPAIDRYTFDQIHSPAVLYVPAESLQAYQSAEYWSAFEYIAAIGDTVVFPADIVPTVDDLAKTYDLENNVVLCCYFDETPCNMVVLTGSFNGWSTEFEECPKFNPVEGYEGWWVAEAPYAEDFSAKPIQLKSNGSFSWDYQTGDAEAWIYKGGNVADVEQGYDGEANISYPSAGAYIYEIAYWKNHKTPCDESKTHNYTLVLYDPSCEEHPEFTPCVAGGFNSWTFTSLERSAAGDSAWMVVVEAEEGSSYKFAESTIGWNNEFQYYDATEDQWMYFGNYEFPAASDDTTLIFDFSNLEYFRYAQCAAATTSGICGDSLTWELSDGVLVIRGTGAMYDYLMEDAPWSKELTTVIMEEGVTTIGAQAFTECANLTSVSIPSTVTTMGVFAFSDCSSLQSIYLGDNLTKIPTAAFQSCTNLTEVMLGDKVTVIGESAFNSCSSLSSINIPNSVTTIETGVFNYCNSLSAIIIPESVTTIGDWALAECNSLTAIIVDDNNANYSSIDGVLFSKDVSELIQCPAGIQGDFTIPEEVTELGHASFAGCYGLTSILIPNSVVSIDSMAFHGCRSLQSIEIPDNVTYMGINLFNACQSMTSVTLGSGTTHLGQYFFSWCSSLTTITCRAQIPPTFGEDVFNGVENSITVYVPEESIEAYQSADGWSDFTIRAIGTEPLAVQYYLVGSGEELGRWLLEKALPMDSGVIVLNLPVNAYEFKVLVDELSWDNLMGYESVNHDCSSEGLEEGTSGNVKFTLTQESEVIIAVVDGMLCVQGNFGGTVEVTGYSVVGDSALVGADWDTSFTQTEMTRQEDGTWTYTIPSITLAAGDYLYKFAANHTWAVEQYPDDMDNYVLTIEKNGIYSVTFTLVPGEGGTASANMIEDLTPEENLTGVCGENLTWELKDSVLTILGTGAMSWEEYAPWRDYAERITTIELPEGLTNIYNQAFYGCANLKNVTIPNSVERIEDSAFMGCSSMTSIVIPESVDTIGQFAFRECKSLISVTINSDAVAGTDYVSIYITSMSDLFGKQLEEVIFGESVTRIGKNALYYSSVSVCNLRSVTVPNSVTEIGSRAFYNCASLESLNVPESVTTIGEDAFRHVNVWYNGNAAGSPWGAKCLNGNCDLYPVAIDVQDGSLSDWDNLPAEYVFETTCPEDASLQGLKSVKVYADQTYINLLVEPNMNVITDLSWVPFHVIINTDNSDMTGGYGYEFMDANADILLEGSVFSDGEPILYNPAVYKWWGEVGGTDFQWSDPDVEPSADNYWGAIVGEGILPIGNSQYVDGKFEIQLLRELIPSDAGWNENEFGIGFDIQQSWESVGILPLVSPTDDNPNGYTQKLQVKISDVVVNPSDTVEVTVYSVIGDSALVGAEWDVDNTLTEMTQQDDGTWTYAIPSVALDSGYYAYKFVSNHSWSGEQYPDESHNYVLNIEQTGNYFVLFTLVSGEGGTAVATLLEDSIPETDTIPTIIRVQIDGLYYFLNDSTRTAEVTAEIEYSADNYKDLTEANIPESVIYLRKEYSLTSIGDNAFYGCVTLSSVSLPNNLTNIGSMAFFNCSITSVNIPWAVASIGQQAFVFCSSLDSITVDSQNKVYDSRNNCNAIIETATSTLIVGCRNTTIPDNVIVIGNQAFSGCSDLETITIPNSVVSLGDESFYGCTSMTSVTIPESVTQIGTSAFAYDSKLASVTSLAMTPPALGKTVFEDVDKSIPLYVHKSSIESYQAANGWNEFENILFRSIEDTVITCGPEFEWHEMILTESGDYEFELEDGTIHILHLTLIQTIEQTDSITIYDNDSLIWHDRVLYETGTYCDTIRSQQADCDSLIICLELTVLPYIPPTVTIFGLEVEVTDPSDSTIIVDEVDILGDSSLIYSTSDNTLTLNETLMEAGDSVSAAISYTGTDPLTIVLNDSSTIFADTIIASTSDIIITGDGTLLAEGTVPIIGVPEANITFDSVSMVVRSLPSAAAVRRRIKGGKRLDETGGPALSGFGSTDFNKVEVSPSDAMYGPVNTGGSDVLSALYVLNAYGEQEFVTKFTLTAKADTPDAVESVTTGQASAIRKVLQDGQLLIIRGNDTFNIVGVRVQ